MPDKNKNLKCPKCGWHMFIVKFKSVSCQCYRDVIGRNAVGVDLIGNPDEIKTHYFASGLSSWNELTDFLRSQERPDDTVQCERCSFVGKREDFERCYEDCVKEIYGYKQELENVKKEIERKIESKVRSILAK